MNVLEVRDLRVEIEDKEILKGLNLKVELGKINALMGPNGSGKSTLAYVLMGHPKYKIISGRIFFAHSADSSARRICIFVKLINRLGGST